MISGDHTVGFTAPLYAIEPYGTLPRRRWLSRSISATCSRRGMMSGTQSCTTSATSLSCTSRNTRGPRAMSQSGWRPSRGADGLVAQPGSIF